MRHQGSNRVKCWGVSHQWLISLAAISEVHRSGNYCLHWWR